MSFGARRLAHLVLAAAAAGHSWCMRTVGHDTSAPPVNTGVTQGHANPLDPAPQVAEYMYEGGLQNGWQDWGWSPKEMTQGGPAMVHFDKYGGWILAKPGLQGDYGGVLFRVKEPPGEGEFVEVHLIASGGNNLPKVNVGPDRPPLGRRRVDGGLHPDRPARPRRNAVRPRRHPGVPPVRGDAGAGRQDRADEGGAAADRQLARPEVPDAHHVGDRLPRQGDAREPAHLRHRVPPTRTMRRPGAALSSGAPLGGNLTSTYNWEINAW